MARFSFCSQCNKRTRKVVKDVKTLKKIYLCPKCSKSKEERELPEEEHTELQCAQLEAEMVLDVELESPEEPKLPTIQHQPLPLPLPAPCPTRHHAPGLQTPPIMQTVVINGRKYIAVSATASDN